MLCGQEKDTATADHMSPRSHPAVPIEVRRMPWPVGADLCARSPGLDLLLADHPSLCRAALEGPCEGKCRVIRIQVSNQKMLSLASVY